MARHTGSPQLTHATGAQRPCARGAWCASAVTVDTPDGPARVPLEGPRAFCDADRGMVAAALDLLPRDYACLAADLGRHPAATAPARSPLGPRVPLALGTEALMRSFAEVLASWHERVAAVASLAPLPAAVRDGWLVARAAAVLAPRLDALLALEPQPVRRAISHRALAGLEAEPDGIVRPGYAATWPDLSGADAGLEILRLHRLARAALGETRPRPVELLGVPCRREDCDMLALRRADLPPGAGPGDEDAPWSECRACGDVMTEAEYRDWTRRYARWAQGRQPEALA